MFFRESRRAFLRHAASGSALIACNGVLPMAGLSSNAFAEKAGRQAIVSLQSDIEPLVRLLEDTPRERLVETVATRISQGLSYRDLLAALLLAGVRNVEPRPSVGFKFDAVLVVQSMHLASVAAPDGDRWLPIFWLTG